MTPTGARQQAADADPGVTLEPVRAVTYRTTSSRRLADVTMRPVEVWDDDLVRRLTTRHPDHVLHLVAPNSAVTLSRWLSAGVVVSADTPSLYGWSWQVAGHRVSGVAGAVPLPVHDRLLPHERVHADIVTARAAWLGGAAVQAEPIVVLHGGRRLGLALLPPPGTTPLVDLSVADERHLVWPLQDPELVAAVTAALRAGPAPVIADGHHRLAALDALAAEHRDGQSGISHALVLVVDVGASDLVVRTVNRVVPDLDVDRVIATTGSRLEPVGAGQEAEYLRTAAPGQLRFVLADGSRLLGLDVALAVVHALHPGAAATCSPVARDTCHLHSHLLPAWGVPEAGLRYVHSWERARRTAADVGGLAIGTSSPRMADVLGAAWSGHLLPHKATSIGPKPRIGLLNLSRDGAS